MKIATHPVKGYWSLLAGGMPLAFKFFHLKKVMAGLIKDGRVILSVRYGEKRYIDDFILGWYTFDTVYIGRKRIREVGISHRMRQTHRKFMHSPIVIKEVK